MRITQDFVLYFV